MKAQSIHRFALLGLLLLPLYVGAQEGGNKVIGEKTPADDGSQASAQRIQAVSKTQLRKGAMTAPVAKHGGLVPRPSVANDPGNHENTSPKDPTPVDPKGPDKLSAHLGTAARTDWAAGKDEPKEPKDPKDPKGPDKLSTQLLRNDALRAAGNNAALQGQP